MFESGLHGKDKALICSLGSAATEMMSFYTHAHKHTPVNAAAQTLFTSEGNGRQKAETQTQKKGLI